MKKEEKPLLPEILKAVQPLTKDGIFHLDTVEYGTRLTKMQLYLISKEMTIAISQKIKGDTQLEVFVFINSIDKGFNLKYLIPALNLSISIKPDCNNKNFQFPPIILDGNEDVREIEYNIQKAGFLPEVNRLCIQIFNELPEISRRFSADNCDKTMAHYAKQIGDNLF